jgi:ATP-dependent RNA helicase DDX10/DBP4
MNERKPKSKVGKAKRRAHNKQKTDSENVEIDTLIREVEEKAPNKGTNPLASLTDLNSTNFVEMSFSDLPISQRTIKGLRDATWERMTHIQAASLPHALAGRDVLGAAKTGVCLFLFVCVLVCVLVCVCLFVSLFASLCVHFHFHFHSSPFTLPPHSHKLKGSGKTLCFIIAILEKLFRLRWSQWDGLGSIIISPTRELALQSFDVLRTAGELCVCVCVDGVERMLFMCV